MLRPTEPFESLSTASATTGHESLTETSSEIKEQMPTRALFECIDGCIFGGVRVGWGGMSIGEGGISMPGTDWRVEGKYFEYCSYDYLCPCVSSNMAKQPTNGECPRAPLVPINSDRLAGGLALPPRTAARSAALIIASRSRSGLSLGRHRK